MEIHRRYVGNTGSQGGFEGVWDAYSSHLDYPQEVGSGKVGVSLPNICSLLTGSGVIGWGRWEIPWW